MFSSVHTTASKLTEGSFFAGLPFLALTGFTSSSSDVSTIDAFFDFPPPSDCRFAAGLTSSSSESDSMMVLRFVADADFFAGDGEGFAFALGLAADGSGEGEREMGFCIFQYDVSRPSSTTDR